MFVILNVPLKYRLVSGSNKVGNEVQIIVPPHKFGEFGEFDVKFHLNAEIITWNLQEYFQT